MANSKDASASMNTNENQHLTMLAAAAAISISSTNNRNSTNLMPNYYSNSSLKRGSQNLVTTAATKRTKSGCSSPFNTTSMGYKVEELLKNQNYLPFMDDFASSVSPTLLASVKANDASLASKPNFRFLDDVMNKAIEKNNLLQHDKQNDGNCMQSQTAENLFFPPKSDNNTIFNNAFNGSAALVTSIALARKALECRNGLAAAAAATLAASTNNTFNGTSFLANSNNNLADTLSTSSLFNSFASSISSSTFSNVQSNVTSTLNNEKTTNVGEYLPRSKSPDYQSLVSFILYI